MPQATTPRRYEFSGIVFEPASGEVLRGGGRVRLARQPAAVLDVLLEHAGDVVTRDQLRAQIWPADTFVDFEHGINAAINRIRDVLGDTASRSRLIETLPRRGYRLMVPVKRLDVADDVSPARRTVVRTFSLSRLTPVLALVGVALGGVALWRPFTPGTPPTFEGADSAPSAARRACDTGRQFLARGTEQGYNLSVEYFRRATEMDPAMSSAHAGLAESHALAVWNLYAAPGERREAALAAASRARRLDDTLPAVQRAIGWVKWVFEWDWVGAEDALRQAVELAPNDQTNLAAYATLLTYSGRQDTAMVLAIRQLQADPLAQSAAIQMASLLLAGNRPGEAAALLGELAARGVRSPRIEAFTASVSASTGACRDASAAGKRALQMSGGDPDDQILLTIVGWAAGVCGERSRTAEIFARLDDIATRRAVDPVTLAIVHAALGDRERALVLLERAVAMRSAGALSIAHDPMLNALHGDPRFEHLVRRIGAPRANR